MKKLLIACVILVLSCACQQRRETVSVNIECPNLEDSASIYLSRLAVNQLEVIDTFTVQSGKCNIRIQYRNQNPEFMYLSEEAGIFASFVALPGEQVKVRYAGTAASCQVTGSEETELMQQVLVLQNSFQRSSDSLSQAYVEALSENREAEAHRLNSKLSTLYTDYKKESIKHLIHYPSSITTVPVLYAKVFGSYPLFGTNSDVIYFQNSLKHLKQNYPSSPYVKFLEHSLQKVEDSQLITEHLQQMKEVSFPEISLSDIHGEQRNLSDLSGKVILLSFWSAEGNGMKMYNLELIRLHNRYNASGFEIYQVSPDLDKNLWASVVKSQELPWISVNDTEGKDSPALASYNVSKLPTSFLINRKGEIVAKDIYNIADLDKTIQRLL